MENTAIVSRSNELVKKIRKLRDKKYRERYGEYVAEGKRWVSDAMRLCPDAVVAVVRSTDCECDFADYTVDAAIMRELTETEHGQGIMAIMRIPEEDPYIVSDCCLYLDRVRDPGNMGAVIRTACAAGYTDIILSDCVDVYNPKVVRSSMTGLLGIRFHTGIAPKEIAELGYTLVASTLDGDNLFEAEPFGGKICLVIGNEADGISEAVKECCKRKVTIPMSGEMESLNAAVSAGILMYELKYKR